MTKHGETYYKPIESNEYLSCFMNELPVTRVYYSFPLEY